MTGTSETRPEREKEGRDGMRSMSYEDMDHAEGCLTQLRGEVTRSEVIDLITQSCSQSHQRDIEHTHKVHKVTLSGAESR